MKPRPLESPSWASDALELCGFTLRGGIQPEAMACVQQVHGAQVHRVSSGAAPAEGDGLWTSERGLAVAVRVADCVPVLLWDPEAAAVAAVHAGWRGTAQDIVGRAVLEGASLGVEAGRLRAALGPSIGPCCFEVGPEVVDALRALGLSDPQIGLRTGAKGRPHVDLRATNRALLTRAGLPEESIEQVGGCTYCDPDRYESYRRDGPASGRMRGLISLAALALLSILSLAGCQQEPLDDAGFAAQAEAAAQALEEGEAAEAEALLRDLTDRRPDDPWTRVVLGEALHAQGRHREALVQSRLALGMDPTFWEAAYAVATHHAALGDEDAAIRWLQAALGPSGLVPEEVASDPKLSLLQDDHRFRFYLNTGVLSRQDDDALLLLHQPSVAVGETATLSLITIGLNRPLMEERVLPQVTLLGRLPQDVLIPVSRRETFSVGVEGSREYRQRTVHYSFRPTKPGLLFLGPFEVQQGEQRLQTSTVVLQVLDTESAPFESSSFVGLERPELFFRAPSTDDGRLEALHEASSDQAILLDPLATEAVEATWEEGASGRSRTFRFKAASVEALPAQLPPREARVFRSVLVMRATEGWSHVLELQALQ